MVHLNLNIRTSGMALKHTNNPSVKDSFTVTVLAMLDSYIGLTEIFILSTSLIPHLLSELELIWLYACFFPFFHCRCVLFSKCSFCICNKNDKKKLLQLV